MTAYRFARRLFVCAAMFVAAAASAQASVQISSNPTHNMNCADGVCTPTAKNADLNATDLANMLASGDVKVVTGAGAVTITVSQSFSWTSTHRLTLDAYYNVTFRASVVVAGQGAITIVTNDGGTGGDLIFFEGGKLDFWDLGSSLIINGDVFTLEGDYVSLANAATANPSGKFALAKDANAGGVSEIETFLGKFDGLGHEISHLRIRAHKFQIGQNSKFPRDVKTIGAGMFGYLDGEVRNVRLKSVTIADYLNIRQGHYPDVFLGGIAAFADEASIVDNVYVSGVIGSSADSQFAHAGGLLGDGRGIVSRSFADVSVGCREDCIAGALVGLNSGVILLTAAFGAVECQDHCGAGGFVGAGGGAIDQSYSEVDVTATGDQNSYAYAGGIGGGGFSGTVTNSYAIGSATAYTEAGGLCGGCQPNINSFYSLVGVGHATFSGGVIGWSGGGGTAAAAYWDLDTSGISNPHQGAGDIPDYPGITGLTDAQLKSGLPAGFDPNIWGQKKSINNGYPYLLANPPPQ